MRTFFNQIPVLKESTVSSYGIKETGSKGPPCICIMLWSFRRPLHFLKTSLSKVGYWMEAQPYQLLFWFQKDSKVKESKKLLLLFILDSNKNK